MSSENYYYEREGARNSLTSDNSTIHTNEEYYSDNSEEGILTVSYCDSFPGTNQPSPDNTEDENQPSPDKSEDENQPSPDKSEDENQPSPDESEDENQPLPDKSENENQPSLDESEDENQFKNIETNQGLHDGSSYGSCQNDPDVNHEIGNEWLQWAGNQSNQELNEEEGSSPNYEMGEECDQWGNIKSNEEISEEADVGLSHDGNLVLPEHKNRHCVAEEVLQKQLDVWLQRTGVASELYSTVRNNFMNKLLDSNSDVSLRKKLTRIEALNLLIADFLLQEQYKDTLSTFASEVLLENIWPELMAYILAVSSGTESEVPCLENKLLQNMLDSLGIAVSSISVLKDESYGIDSVLSRLINLIGSISRYDFKNLDFAKSFGIINNESISNSNYYSGCEKAKIITIVKKATQKVDFMMDLQHCINKMLVNKSHKSEAPDYDELFYKFKEYQDNMDVLYQQTGCNLRKFKEILSCNVKDNEQVLYYIFYRLQVLHHQLKHKLNNVLWLWDKVKNSLLNCDHEDIVSAKRPVKFNILKNKLNELEQNIVNIQCDEHFRAELRTKECLDRELHNSENKSLTKACNSGTQTEIIGDSQYKVRCSKKKSLYPLHINTCYNREWIYQDKSLSHELISQQNNRINDLTRKLSNAKSTNKDGSSIGSMTERSVCSYSKFSEYNNDNSNELSSEENNLSVDGICNPRVEGTHVITGNTCIKDKEIGTLKKNSSRGILEKILPEEINQNYDDIPEDSTESYNKQSEVEISPRVVNQQKIREEVSAGEINSNKTTKAINNSKWLRNINLETVYKPINNFSELDLPYVFSFNESILSAQKELNKLNEEQSVLDKQFLESGNEKSDKKELRDILLNEIITRRPSCLSSLYPLFNAACFMPQSAQISARDCDIKHTCCCSQQADTRLHECSSNLKPCVACGRSLITQSCPKDYSTLVKQSPTFQYSENATDCHRNTDLEDKASQHSYSISGRVKTVSTQVFSVSKLSADVRHTPSDIYLTSDISEFSGVPVCVTLENNSKEVSVQVLVKYKPPLSHGEAGYSSDASSAADTLSDTSAEQKYANTAVTPESSDDNEETMDYNKSYMDTMQGTEAEAYRSKRNITKSTELCKNDLKYELIGRLIHSQTVYTPNATKKRKYRVSIAPREPTIIEMTPDELYDSSMEETIMGKPEVKPVEEPKPQRKKDSFTKPFLLLQPNYDSSRSGSS